MTDKYTIFENGISRDATEDEVAEIKQREANATANALAKAVATFNQDRAAKLAETDWWAIRASEQGGAPMTDAQLSYRSELRAMDNAEGFDPFNPNWPVKPENNPCP